MWRQGFVGVIPPALLELQELAEATFEARHAGCLERAPAIILSVGTPSGGRFTLLHQGHRQTVEPVDGAFATLKYVAHAPLGLFGALFPGATTAQAPDSKALEALQGYLAATLDQVETLPVDADSRRACRLILELSLEFSRHPKAAQKEEFTAYSRRVGPAVGQTMRRAAQVQLDGIAQQVEHWRHQIGESDWQGLYAAVASGWARVNNSPRQQALEIAMGSDAARRRLFSIQGVKTEEALLQRLSKILNQHELGELFFEDRERLDEDLMGRPAREILETSP